MVWRCCERLGIKPPDVKDNWVDCNIWAQCQLIAYDQIREIENQELMMAGMIQ